MGISKGASRCWSELIHSRYKSFLKELQTKQGLKEVALVECELHRTNVRELGDALFRHPTLTSISLRGCRIGDAAGSLLVALLRAHPQLTAADFSNNNISKTSVNEIISALESNLSVTQLSIGLGNVEATSGLLRRFSTVGHPSPDQIARIRTLCEANTELRASMRSERPRAQLKYRNLSILPPIIERCNLVALDVRPHPISALVAGFVFRFSFQAWMIVAPDASARLRALFPPLFCDLGN